MATLKEQIWAGMHRLRSWPGLHRVASNTIWLFGHQAMALLVAALVGVWTARYLGPSSYGDLNFALSFVFLFSPIATLGLDKVLVRELVRNPKDSPRLLGSAFVFRLLSGLTATLAATATAFVVWPQERDVPWLISIAALGLILQAAQVVEFWFSSRLEGKYVVMARVAALLLSAGVKAVLIIIHAPLLTFAVVWTGETLVGSLLLFVIYRWRGCSPAQWVVSTGEGIKLVRQAWPILLATMAQVLYTRVDQLLLKEMWGAAVVGIYAASFQVLELLYFLPTAMISSAFPAIICLRQAKAPEYRLRMQQLYDFLTWLGLGIASVVSLSSSFLMALLFGPAFEDSGPVLAVSVWCCVFVFPALAYGHWLYAEDLQFYGLISFVSTCLLNLVLNFYLIPFQGAAGAALASVLSYGAGTLIAPLLWQKTRRGALPLYWSLALPLRVCRRFWRRHSLAESTQES
jgi:PST family polysaccharide transporter